MTMHINFIQRCCDLCGRYISRPNFGRHREVCERKRAKPPPATEKPTYD